MRNSAFRPLAPALAALLALSPALRADELAQLREQIHALEHKLLVLERKQEIQDERIAVTDKGVTLASADAANSLKLRGLVQLDHRLFLNDGGIVNNGFVLRRARLIAEAQFAKTFTFQIVPEFGGSSVSLVDANVGIAVSPALQFKLGRLKSPVGYELLQSDSWTFFNERSIVTNLVPNRDLGITAGGDVLDGRLSYTVGVFNGVADGASSTNSDFDNEKDFVGRVFASPFRNALGSPLQGLSFGLAGSYGRQKTAAGRTSGYRTDGQQTFFSYLTTTVADGPSWRVSPQADFRKGPLGLIGEYVLSTVNVRPSATGPKAGLQNRGWQIAGGYVLTGEDSSYNGVVPRTNFDPAAGTWGAFEVTGRYANVRIDDAAFPIYASASASASEATSFGLGLNWYLGKAVVFKLDYYQTNFGFAAGAPAVSATPALRQDEKSIITRFQLSF
ncbi:porin [Opitutus sp. GAS368]|uniref:OprO/OprP family phosphate-selective porin n=1 Tax=Opitutus sp. GAS368 TaxID=1882749 RepID=UPI00087DC970|nr:porin [Opitutus sp. GAS368]SDR71164.1 phosphate-selective porin OprO and OprP [Opitutus sp. GAS368]